MNYELLPTDNAKQMRERFEFTFLKTFASFCDEIPAARRYAVPTVMYPALFRGEITRLDFYDALGELAKIKTPVYFLNDRCPIGEPCVLNRLFVAKTNDIKPFAKQIFDEWCREFYLGSYVFSSEFHSITNNLFNDKIFLKLLPFDLYIFDESMEWMLAFTHEDCEDECEYDGDSSAIEPRRCCYMIRPQ